MVGNIWAVHHDPKLWEKHDEFRPERFLDDNGEFLFSPHVIPFGIGPRYCLGKKMAEMLFFHQLTSLVRRFKILPGNGQSGVANNDCLPSLDESIFGTSNAPLTFQVIMEERNTHNAK